MCFAVVHCRSSFVLLAGGRGQWLYCTLHSAPTYGLETTAPHSSFTKDNTAWFYDIVCVWTVPPTYRSLLNLFWLPHSQLTFHSWLTFLSETRPACGVCTLWQSAVHPTTCQPPTSVCTHNIIIIIQHVQTTHMYNTTLARTLPYM